MNGLALKSPQTGSIGQSSFCSNPNVRDRGHDVFVDLTFATFRTTRTSIHYIPWTKSSCRLQTLCTAMNRKTITHPGPYARCHKDGGGTSTSPSTLIPPNVAAGCDSDTPLVSDCGSGTPLAGTVHHCTSRSSFASRIENLPRTISMKNAAFVIIMCVKCYVCAYAIRSF
jgi:hypothetical protein